jgi:hypothetical protein
MDNRTFENLYNNAVDLHRRGQTAQALSAVDSLLSSADNDDQRIACINEKIHLLDHLGRRDEVLKLGAELASILPKSAKSKALYQFFERGQKAQAAVDAILASHKS